MYTYPLHFLEFLCLHFALSSNEWFRSASVHSLAVSFIDKCFFPKSSLNSLAFLSQLLHRILTPVLAKTQIFSVSIPLKLPPAAPIAAATQSLSAVSSLFLVAHHIFPPASRRKKVWENERFRAFSARHSTINFATGPSLRCARSALIRRTKGEGGQKGLMVVSLSSRYSLVSLTGDRWGKMRRWLLGERLNPNREAAAGNQTLRISNGLSLTMKDMEPWERKRKRDHPWYQTLFETHTASLSLTVKRL